MTGAVNYTVQIQIIIILLAGIIGAKIAERARLPIVIPLVITGYLIGPYSPIGLNVFNPLDLGVSLETITNILIPLILFHAGLSFDVEVLKRIYRPVFALATLGVLISAILFALIGHYLFNIDLISSLLIGTAVAATDIAAVEAVLSGIRIKEEVMSTLIGESAFNDATAIVLVSILLSLIRMGEVNITSAFVEFLRQFIGGILLGYTMGIIVSGLVSKLKLEKYLVYFSLLLFLGTYTIATFILTTYSFVNPAVAVVISGIVFREHFTRRGVVTTEGLHTLSFWENIVFISEVIIFMVLGASISYATISESIVIALVMLVIAILISRPIAVFLSTIGFKGFTTKEKLFMSLLGARGSVSAGLANIILISGIPQSQMSFNTILIITIASLLIVGFGGRKLAKYLCEIEVPPIVQRYESLKAEYLATQEALRELNMRYSEGLLDVETFTQLENELREELARLEKEIASISENEEMKVMRLQELLEERRELIEVKIRYLDHLKARGEISEGAYNKMVNKYRLEIRKIETEMAKIRRRAYRKTPRKEKTKG